MLPCLADVLVTGWVGETGVEEAILVGWPILVWGFQVRQTLPKSSTSSLSTALVVKWSGFLKARRALTPSVLEVLPVPPVLFCALLSWTTSAFLGFLRTFPLATQN